MKLSWLWSWGTNTIPVPSIREVTPSEFSGMLKFGDVLMHISSESKICKLITWGQKLMLKRFGYDQATADQLSKYTHVQTVIDPVTATGFEAVPPKIRRDSIIANYHDTEILILRPLPALDADDEKHIINHLPQWDGKVYGFKEYALYPFYMAYGWVPIWWEKLWDDPGKPVCSTLVIRLLQAAGRYSSIWDPTPYPPARIPLLEGLIPVARVIIRGIKATGGPQGKPWWIG